MKLLYSKSAPEPILLATACPCANLFGIITRSTVAVYRSTTLTVVFNYAFSSLHNSPGAADAAELKPGPPSTAVTASSLHASWSPSGRLLTLALSTGTLLLFDVEGGALVRSFESAAFAASTPSLQTSLPAGRPLIAMQWCSITGSAALPAMLQDITTRCLPIQMGASAALLEEAVQQQHSDRLVSGSVGSLTHTTAAAHLLEPADEATSISLLLLLGDDGVLRVLLGGLQEITAVPLQLPPTADGPSPSTSWASLCVEELSLSAHADCHGDAAPAATHHKLFLTLAKAPQRRSAAPSGAAAPPTLAFQGVVLVADLQDRLARLAAPSRVAFCFASEYCHMADQAYQQAMQRWHLALAQHTRMHLELPNSARLLRDAIVAEVAKPSCYELFHYARRLPTAALLQDVDHLSETLQRIISDLTHISYRCCEAAMAFAVYIDDEAESGLIEPHLQDCSADLSSPSGLTTGRLIRQIGSLRREYEAQLRQVARECSLETDLVLWVVQQSPSWLCNDLPKENEDGAARPPLASAASEEVVVGVSRQPAMLRHVEQLHCTSDGVNDAAERRTKDAAIQQYYDLSKLLADHQKHFEKGSKSIVANGGSILSELGASEPNFTSASPRADFLSFIPVPQTKEGNNSDKHAKLGNTDDGPSGSSATSVGLLCTLSAETPTASSSSSNTVVDSLKLQEHRISTSGPSPSRALCRISSAAVRVDGAAVAAQLKAGAQQTRYEASWYGYLAPDRHVLLYQPAPVLRSIAGARTMSSSLFFAIVDDEGHLVLSNEDDDDDDDDDEEAAVVGGKNGESDKGDGTPCNAAHVALCEIVGMEAIPLRVSLSRARSFCIAVGITKYVVLSLHDDDY